MSDFMSEWPLSRTADVRVPRTMERILEALGADREFSDAVIGDLAEEFAIRASEDGERSARSWYRWESLRVAPYLVRDWWLGLGGKGVARLAGVVLIATVALNVFETATRVALHSTDPGVRSLHAALLDRGIGGLLLFKAIMLLWTFVDGMVGGYVAARLGGRAPMASALALAAAWSVAMVWMTALPTGGLLGDLPAAAIAVALAFRVANIGTLVAGILAGGVLGAGRAGYRSAIFPAPAADLER